MFFKTCHNPPWDDALQREFSSDFPNTVALNGNSPDRIPTERTTSKHQKMGSERAKKKHRLRKNSSPIESGDEGTRYGLWKGVKKILTFYRLWTNGTDCCRRRSVGYITCWADSTIPMMASAVSQIKLDEVL